MSLKIALLHGARCLGLFRLARRITRRSLRILCFHAFAVADEGAFWPGVFHDPALFRRRLDLLARAGYDVVPLGAGVDALAHGALTRPSVALTFDDGFASTKAGLDLAIERGHATTLYVTTYHVERRSPVFRVALQYLCWRMPEGRFDVSASLPSLADPVAAGDAAAVRACYVSAERDLDQPARDRLLAEIAAQLGVDLQPLLADRRFHNLDQAELRALDGRGVDIQLHTHRHRLPLAAAAVGDEIERNRRVLEAALDGGEKRPERVHFCYPSGEWDELHHPWLAGLGIRSATTLDPGLNAPGANPLALRRITENGHMPDIVFAAELSGFMDATRWLRRRAGRLRSGLRAGFAAVASLRDRGLWRRPRGARRLLFVCQGNICRSAFAAAALENEAGEGVTVESCGLDVEERRPSPGIAIRVARHFGVDLAAHRSRPLDAAMMARADLVLAMERGQLDELRRRYPGHTAKCRLLRDYAPLPHGLLAEIADPYGGDERAFARCFRTIRRTLAPLRLDAEQSHA